jgi:molybdate transport system substrate-binding protein
MKRLILLFALIAAVLGGCSKKTDDGSKPTLLLYCAAGIRNPSVDLFAEFTNQTGIEVAPDYAGSEVLLSKIKLSERGDLYMPGDVYYVDQADEAGMIIARGKIAYWVPTIFVQKGNPKNITKLTDILRADIKAGLGDPDACAIGRISKKILEKNNINWTIAENALAFKSMTVNELAMQIQAGSLDMVIIWDALADDFAQYGDQVNIPMQNNIISSIDVGVLSFTENKDAALKLLDFLTSPKAKEIFNKHKYRTEPPQ